MLAIKSDSTLNPEGREVWKRLKFSLRREDLERKIAELDSCTRMLERLRVIGISIYEQTAITTSKKSAKLVRILNNVRKRALLLYNAVSPKWALTCHKNHSTTLILEDRLETDMRRSQKRLSDTQPVDFKLLLRAEEPKLDRKILWHDADIDVLEPKPNNIACTPLASSVRFDLPDTAPELESPLQEVFDLCTCVEGAEDQQKHLKLVVASQAKLYSVHLSPADRTRRSWPANLKLMNLGSILSSKNHSGTPPLQLSHRLRLALILSSSLLQLHATPWTGQHMTKHSVFLFLSSPILLSIQTIQPCRAPFQMPPPMKTLIG